MISQKTGEDPVFFLFLLFLQSWDDASDPRGQTGTRILSDLGPGVTRLCALQPIRVRSLAILIDHDLDDVAALQGAVERGELIIHFGGRAGVADIGMDGIGEIDRRGIFRQVDDIAFGGEDEDAVLEDIDLHLFERTDILLFV